MGERAVGGVGPRHVDARHRGLVRWAGRTFKLALPCAALAGAAGAVGPRAVS